VRRLLQTGLGRQSGATGLCSRGELDELEVVSFRGGTPSFACDDPGNKRRTERSAGERGFRRNHLRHRCELLPYDRLYCREERAIARPPKVPGCNYAGRATTGVERSDSGRRYTAGLRCPGSRTTARRLGAARSVPKRHSANSSLIFEPPLQKNRVRAA
jgi:hypothetical protein